MLASFCNICPIYSQGLGQNGSTNISFRLNSGCFYFKVPKLMTPNRKAARACAGTPEIARGFASVSPRKNTSAKASPLSGRKHRGKSSLDVTPSKQTAKRSITSPRKLSPLRKSSIRSLSKTKTSDRITMKRRAVATLTSVARISPKKALRKKASIFNEGGEASSSLLPDTDKVNHDVVSSSSQSMNDSCNLASNSAMSNSSASSAQYIECTHRGGLIASSLPDQPCLNACSNSSSSSNSNVVGKSTDLTPSTDLSIISDKNGNSIIWKETGLPQDNENVMPSVIDFTVNINEDDNIDSHFRSSDACIDEKNSDYDLANKNENYDDSDAELSGFLMYADDTANTDITTLSDAVSSCGSDLSLNSLRDTPPFLVSDRGYRLTPDLFEANNNNLHVTSTFMNYPRYPQDNSINLPEENKNKPNIIGPTVTNSNSVSVFSQCPSRASASILPQPAPPYSAIKSFHKILEPKCSVGDLTLLEGFTPICSSSKCSTVYDCSAAGYASEEVLDNSNFGLPCQTSSENDVNSNVMPCKETANQNSGIHVDTTSLPVDCRNRRKALQPSPPAIMCVRHFYN